MDERHVGVGTVGVDQADDVVDVEGDTAGGEGVAGVEGDGVVGGGVEVIGGKGPLVAKVDAGAEGDLADVEPGGDAGGLGGVLRAGAGADDDGFGGRSGERRQGDQRGGRG